VPPIGQSNKRFTRPDGGSCAGSVTTWRAGGQGAKGGQDAPVACASRHAARKAGQQIFCAVPGLLPQRSAAATGGAPAASSSGESSAASRRPPMAGREALHTAAEIAEHARSVYPALHGHLRGRSRRRTARRRARILVRPFFAPGFITGPCDAPRPARATVGQRASAAFRTSTRTRRVARAPAWRASPNAPSWHRGHSHGSWRTKL